MRILIIDTCGPGGSVAMADNGQTPEMLQSASLPGRTAAERLVPAIKELAAQTGIRLQSLDAVVVVHGPGSFTGVRVGLSAAKGLCEALHLPLVAISRLAVLAHLAEPPSAAHVHALLDAGRGEFYHGEYADGICLREGLLTRDEVLTAVGCSSPDVVVVSSEQAVAESIAALAPRLVPDPSAESALPLAVRRIHQSAFDDAATLDANYLRRTDLEIFAKNPAHTPPTSSAAGDSQLRRTQPGTPSR